MHSLFLPEERMCVNHIYFKSSISVVAGEPPTGGSHQWGEAINWEALRKELVFA